ncbi:MAG: hypothetical protein AAGK22_29410 [Acidobacteriota bacterium]
MKNEPARSILATALCLTLAGSLMAQDNALRDTVTALREGGTQLFAACEEKHGQCGANFAFAPSDCMAKATAEEARVYVGVAASDDTAIRTLDGWGFELEYWLPVPGCKSAGVGLRSAGDDGLFAGDSYEAGPFSDDDEGQDVVWQSGSFLRWPGQ